MQAPSEWCRGLLCTMDLLSQALSRCFHEHMFCFRELRFFGLLSRRFQNVSVRPAFAARPSFWLFRDRPSQAFACVLALRGSIGTPPPFTTCGYQGFWRCSSGMSAGSSGLCSGSRCLCFWRESSGAQERPQQKVPSPFFPGILLFRKPSKTQGKQPVFEKNDG